MAPADRKERKSKPDLVTRDYTIHLSKLVHKTTILGGFTGTQKVTTSSSKTQTKKS